MVLNFSISKVTIMKYVFKSVRWILGQIIILLDWLTRPKAPVFTPERKAELAAQTAKLALYQFRLCPFCVKTRRAIRRLGLDIELRDARNDPKWNKQLVSEGGKYQVPCLRISTDDGRVDWMYESTEINRYLEKRFGGAAR
jgi:glutaredoxin